MKILLSNDDGIKSAGLKFLAEKLSRDNEVLIVAPKHNFSACSHSLSLNKPIKIKEYFGIKNCKSFCASGTPVDCVKMAEHLFPEFNSEIVVAGINKGHNLGSDILYSSTVAIAYEAGFFNKPAFCFSAFSHGESNFDLFSDYAIKILNFLLPYTKPKTIWNINFPDNNSKILGIKFVPLGKFVYIDKYIKCSKNKYKLKGVVDYNKPNENSDVDFSINGYITITPLIYDKTDYKLLSELNNLCIKL